MTTISLKNNSNIDVNLRNAIQTDIEELIILNHKWQRNNLGENIKDGFLRATLSKDTFIELMIRQQIVVTVSNNKVVGYYLLNNFSKDGAIGKHEDFVIILKGTNKIPKLSSICVGGQVVVDSEYMGSGIRYLMLKILIKNMKGKYDSFFATIAKDNPRAFKAHTRDGWKVVNEDNNLYYVIFEIS